MANYPNFDLNNPRDMSAYYSEEQLATFKEDSTQEMDALNKLWQNFCVTHTYEPGSVQKPFTVACGLDTGTLTTDMTFYVMDTRCLAVKRYHASTVADMA